MYYTANGKLLQYLSTTLCIAQQNFSSSVNELSSGSPSLILIVLLICFGITIWPKSSILRTIPVAFIIYKNSFVDLITLLLSVNKGVLYWKSKRYLIYSSILFRATPLPLRFGFVILKFPFLNVYLRFPYHRGLFLLSVFTGLVQISPRCYFIKFLSLRPIKRTANII